MKYKIKQIDNYAIIISDEDIKKNEYHIFENEVKKTTKQTLEYINSSGDTNFKKVIATIAPYSIEGLPMFELPNQEEDVDFYCWNIAKEIFEQEEGRKPDVNTAKDLLVMSAIQVGYKAAQKQYSESDMRKAFETGRNYQLTGENNFNELLQSLQKKQFPTSVELTEDLQIIKWHYE